MVLALAEGMATKSSKDGCRLQNFMGAEVTQYPHGSSIMQSSCA